VSPRAAWRLETLGFTAVFQYAGGKVDWMAAGLPTEGSAAGQPRAGQRARRDVPRSRLDETRGEASARARAAGWQMSIVVNDHDIVLGLLEGEVLDGDPDTPVASAMRPGPSTVRAHTPAAELAGTLTKRGFHRAIVTTPDGELIGVAFLEDLQRA
jgi:CBS domain-containing protein